MSWLRHPPVPRRPRPSVRPEVSPSAPPTRVTHDPSSVSSQGETDSECLSDPGPDPLVSPTLPVTPTESRLPTTPGPSSQGPSCVSHRPFQSVTPSSTSRVAVSFVTRVCGREVWGPRRDPSLGGPVGRRSVARSVTTRGYSPFLPTSFCGTLSGSTPLPVVVCPPRPGVPSREELSGPTEGSVARRVRGVGAVPGPSTGGCWRT